MPSRKKDIKIIIAKVAFCKYATYIIITCFIVWNVLDTLKMISGQWASVALRFSANINCWLISFLIVCGALTYGFNERKLRLQTIKQLAPEKQAREEMLDPQRSSSGLTSDGQTPKD